MPGLVELGSGSSSITVLNKKEVLGDDRFRWKSIQNYVYFASTYSAIVFNFDMFSKVSNDVRVIDFLICETFLGITYLCMDSFIKQYTKRFDCNRYMSPLLRGVSYGRFLQTLMIVAVHSSYLADGLRFLLFSFEDVPPWSECNPLLLGNNISHCIPTKDIIEHCKSNMTTSFSKSSALFNYMTQFRSLDRSALTARFFVLGLVWVIIFFFASVSEETLAKILRLAFLTRTLSTFVTVLFILLSTQGVATKAFTGLIDVFGPSDFLGSVQQVTYAYGVGFLGIYDYGSVSTFTMTDTAVVVFAATFTLLAFIRSWIVKMLLVELEKCVSLEKKYGTHTVLFSILPLATEFFYAHKLYVFYIYGNLMFTTMVFMTNLVFILSKFLSYEFRAVKQIYIVGLLCCVCFTLSIPLLALMAKVKRTRAFLRGLDIITPYIGATYVAIVMWLYGLRKFCTDIQFWLGFRPTRFWTISWALLPVVFYGITILRTYKNLTSWSNPAVTWLAIGWAAGSFLLIAFMNIKTMAKFIVRNNLTALFQSHKNHGPPEMEERKRRIYYSEYTRQRKCKHHCLVIDDWFDCRHKPVTLTSESMLQTSSSEESLMNIYDARTTSRLRSVGALTFTTPRQPAS